MYGGRPPVKDGPHPAVGTSGSATGGSLADDGTKITPPRRSGPGASSGARQASAGGDDSIFSSAEGLTKLARSRAASSYAGSAHGGSQSSRQGAGAPRPDPSHKVTYYGEASRRAGSVGSQGSGDNRDHRDHPRSPSRPARESRARRAPRPPTATAPSISSASSLVVSPDRSASANCVGPRRGRHQIHQGGRDGSETSRGTHASRHAEQRGVPQTEVADLRDDNPNAQLKFQAAASDECQEALAEARMRAA